MAELFEARKPKEQALVSEIDGIVEFRSAQKGKRVVMVKGGEVTKEYDIPKGKHVSVHEGDWVKAGEPLMDGAVNPHSILDILGPKELQRYLVDEVQKVYRLQGVTINDKHIEVIVRQMMRKVRIEDPGDTMFLIGEQVDRMTFQEENEKVKTEGGTPAQGKPLLLGITKASLTTDSFVCRFFPGNNESPHRGCDKRHGRRTEGSQGKCDHGEGHPCRYRHVQIQKHLCEARRCPGPVRTRGRGRIDSRFV